ERIIGIDGERAGNPFTRSFHITEFEEGARTQVRRPGIIGMQYKFALGKLESEARCLFTIFDPAEGSITMDAKDDRLVIIRPDLRGAFEKTGGQFSFSFRETCA